MRLGTTACSTSESPQSASNASAATITAPTKTMRSLMLIPDAMTSPSPPPPMKFPNFTPKAKANIVLFLRGGPSQLDMFDPKPSLLKYQGQRPSSVDLRTERTTGGLLLCLSKDGKQEQALAELTGAVKRNAEVDPDVAYAVGSVYALNRDNEEAFAWLEKSVALGNANKPWWEMDANLSSLRNDPRFGELMKKMAVNIRRLR